MMQCEFCMGETIRRRVRKHHWHQARLYIVEQVSAEVCRECGERYFHARTLDALDALVEGQHDVKEVLSVEVINASALA